MARRPHQKTYRTAVVVVPPRELWEPIQRIRQRHDRKVRRWMPHITLLYPFVPPAQFRDVLPKLRQACREAAPFQVTLRRMDTFCHRSERYTMWLEPEPSEPLVRLYERLWTSVWTEPVSRRFRPHLSVGQVEGRARRDELVARLQADWRPLSFLVERVSVLCREEPPDDVFRVEEEIRLGPDRP